MTRVLLVAFTLLAAACGHKSSQSLCANEVPPPAECNTDCDPAPGAPTTCPVGYHCSAGGKCDTFCTPGGGQCGDGYTCTEDGFCIGNGSDGPLPVDADCPEIHFAATPVTPSIHLLIDRSSSMTQNFANQDPAGGNGPYKFATVQDALVGPQGVVTQFEGSVYFGATLFTAFRTACPSLQTTARVKNNKAAIAAMITSNPPRLRSDPDPGYTPTPMAIDAVVADFAANAPPAGSPPVIVLATDGQPNECTTTSQREAESVAAATNAFTHGIKLYILAVSFDDAGARAHVQAMANAGQGVQPGEPDATPYYATNPTNLAAAFQSIIGGIVSCDLTISRAVNQEDGQRGTVVLNGMNLTYPTDWTLDPDGKTIHLLGNACTILKASTNPKVDATFPCGTVFY